MDKAGPEVTRSLRAWGFNTYKTRDGRQVPHAALMAYLASFKGRPVPFDGLVAQINKISYLPEDGKADIFAYKNGKAALIEVKNGTTSFAFSDWRENQRDWAYKYAISPPYNTMVWLWLQLGIDQPHWDKEKYSPRRAWLMPVTIFMEVEKIISSYQASIPYRVKKGMRKEIQEQKLDAITVFQAWELTWQNGFWQLPVSHIFYQTYMSEP